MINEVRHPALTLFFMCNTAPSGLVINSNAFSWTLAAGLGVLYYLTMMSPCLCLACLLVYMDGFTFASHSYYACFHSSVLLVFLLLSWTAFTAAC